MECSADDPQLGPVVPQPVTNSAEVEDVGMSLERNESDITELAEMVEKVRLDILNETSQMNPNRHTPNWDFDNLDGTWGDHPEGMGHRGGLIKNTKRKKEMGELVHQMWKAFDELSHAICIDQFHLRHATSTGNCKLSLKKLGEEEMRRRRKLQEVSIMLTHIESQITSEEDQEAEADLAKKERMTHPSTRKPVLSSAVNLRPVSANPRANLRTSSNTMNRGDSTSTPNLGAVTGTATSHYMSKSRLKQPGNTRTPLARMNHLGRFVGQQRAASNMHVRYRHLLGGTVSWPATGNTEQKQAGKTGEAEAPTERRLEARKVKRDPKGYRDASDSLGTIPVFHRSSHSLTQLNRFEVRPTSAHTFLVTRGEESRPRNRHRLRTTPHHQKTSHPTLRVFKMHSKGEMPRMEDPNQILMQARELSSRPSTSGGRISVRGMPTTAAAAATNWGDESMTVDLRVHTKFRGGKLIHPTQEPSTLLQANGTTRGH